MPKYLFISNAETVNNFRQKFSPEIEISQWYYDDICLFTSDEFTEVKNEKTGETLTDFAKIMVMSAPEEKYPMLSSIGCFARKNNIDMIDQIFPNYSGKLYEAFRLNEDGISIPETASGPADFLKKKLADFGGTAVLKAEHGTKGRENYLVHSPEEIDQILTSGLDYVLQKFIPNDGDYRVLAINHQPQIVFRRKGNGEDHRNNTSQGGTIELIENPNPAITELAVRATKALGIKLAGADIIENKETGKLSVLEVNRTPQIASSSAPEDLRINMIKTYLES